MLWRCAPLRAQVMRDAKSTTLSFSNGLEFKVGEGGGGMWTRGALPKGTTRKCAKPAGRLGL